MIKGRYRNYDNENLLLKKEWKIVGEREGQKICLNEHNKFIMII